MRDKEGGRKIKSREFDERKCVGGQELGWNGSVDNPGREVWGRAEKK